MLIDQPDTADHQLDPGDIQPDPGASQPDPGASQPNPGANHPAPGASLAEGTRLQLLQHDAFAKYPTPGWAQPYLDFLIQGTLPEDEVLARQIQRRAKAYTIINNRLNKRSAGSMYLRCVEPELGHRLLENIHKGECGHHASTRATCSKAIRYGFYWPTINANAEKMIKACNGCQRFWMQKQTPSSVLRTIPIT